jgi:hypothetical protein
VGSAGTADEISADVTADTASIVTISAPDKGFSAEKRGAWTRQ